MIFQYILIIICILLILLITINANWAPIKPKFYIDGTAIIVGHRGAPFISHENTLESFDQAFKLGLNIIELDVQLSKDKKLVIFHDWFIKDHNKNKNICSLNYSEIKRISNNSNFHIPLLSDVLNLLPNNCFINIEIKSIGLFKFTIERKIMDLINSKNIIENVIISSFNPFTVRRIKKMNKNIFTSLIWTNKSSPFLINSPFWIYFCKPDGLHIDYCFANKKFIQWGKN